MALGTPVYNSTGIARSPTLWTLKESLKGMLGKKLSVCGADIAQRITTTGTHDDYPETIARLVKE